MLAVIVYAIPVLFTGLPEAPGPPCCGLAPGAEWVKHRDTRPPPVTFDPHFLLRPETGVTAAAAGKLLRNMCSKLRLPSISSL